MDPVAVIQSVLQLISQVPAIGKVVAVVLAGVVALSAVITAVVGVWHGVIALVQALASFPGLSGLQNLANTLKVDDAVVTAKSSDILNWINRLSAISIPAK